jgi:hypothetical protein
VPAAYRGIVARYGPTIPVQVLSRPDAPAQGGIMGRVKQRKRQLSTKELMQLTIWGGLLLIILLGLVYGLVRAGAVIPVGGGVEHHAAGAISGNAPDSRP